MISPKGSIQKMTIFYLQQLFGESLRINILEILIKAFIQESSNIEEPNSQIIYLNGAQIAEEIDASKSAVHLVIDKLLEQNFIIRKHVETHQQNPPKLVRLNTDHGAVKELIFFYKKLRSFL